MFNTFTKVFRGTSYVIIAIVISIIVFTFAVWLPNVQLIIDVIASDTILWSDKLNFLFSLYESITTNFSGISASYTIAIAILFGINIALLVYYIRSKQTLAIGSGATLGVGGLISGVFGIGCAACGTFILSSLLGAFGAVGILSFLPFGGEEFGFLGVGLLAYSIYSITKKISEPVVCSVEV